MTKLTKNLISCVVALSLGATIGVISALADDDPVSDPSPPSRTLATEFMGVGATPVSNPNKKRLTEDDVNKEFWIGLTADNLNSDELFTNGIYSFEVAFEYDPSYVIPYNTDSGNPNGEWAAELTKGSFGSGLWDSSKYTLVTTVGSDLNLHEYRQGLEEAAGKKTRDGWKMCTIIIRYKENVTFANARFQGLTSADKQYLLKVPFILRKVPGETDDDVSPLSVVRGPETFSIGSGSDGTDPHYEWYSDQTYKADENLKLLFKDKTAISLFSTETITNITPLNATPTDTPKPDAGDGEAAATPTPRPALPLLSQTKELQGDGFESSVEDYYLSVPNEVEKIQFEINAPVSVNVSANGETARDADNDGEQTYKSHVITLLEYNTDTTKGGEADGYNNTIVVSDGNSKTYTIHVRRLLKPKIELNYGNSPYGEIMRMTTLTDGEGNPSEDRWTEEYAEEVKKDFNSSNSFTSANCPEGGIKGRSYTLNAWGGSEKPDVNMDRNDYALFVYDRRDFTDPGVTAYSTTGEPVTEITRKITVKRMSESSVSSLTSHNYVDDEEVSVTSTVNEYKFTEITSASKSPVVPAVYDLEYSFTDPMTHEKVTEIRPLVVLWRLGDADMTNQVNSQDIPTVYSVVRGGIKIGMEPSDTVTKEESDFSKQVENLYFYRIADADLTNQVNAQDIPTIYSIIRGAIASEIYKLR